MTLEGKGGREGGGIKEMGMPIDVQDGEFFFD